MNELTLMKNRTLKLKEGSQLYSLFSMDRSSFLYKWTKNEVDEISFTAKSVSSDYNKLVVGNEIILNDNAFLIMSITESNNNGYKSKSVVAKHSAIRVLSGGSVHTPEKQYFYNINDLIKSISAEEYGFNVNCVGSFIEQEVELQPSSNRDYFDAIKINWPKSVFYVDGNTITVYDEKSFYAYVETDNDLYNKSITINKDNNNIVNKIKLTGGRTKDTYQEYFSPFYIYDNDSIEKFGEYEISIEDRRFSSPDRFKTYAEQFFSSPVSSIQVTYNRKDFMKKNNISRRIIKTKIRREGFIDLKPSEYSFNPLDYETNVTVTYNRNPLQPKEYSNIELTVNKDTTPKIDWEKYDPTKYPYNYNIFSSGNSTIHTPYHLTSLWDDNSVIRTLYYTSHADIMSQLDNPKQLWSQQYKYDKGIEPHIKAYGENKVISAYFIDASSQSVLSDDLLELIQDLVITKQPIAGVILQKEVLNKVPFLLTKICYEKIIADNFLPIIHEISDNRLTTLSPSDGIDLWTLRKLSNSDASLSTFSASYALTKTEDDSDVTWLNNSLNPFSFKSIYSNTKLDGYNDYTHNGTIIIESDIAKRKLATRTGAIGRSESFDIDVRITNTEFSSVKFSIIEIDKIPFLVNIDEDIIIGETHFIQRIIGSTYYDKNVGNFDLMYIIYDEEGNPVDYLYQNKEKAYYVSKSAFFDRTHVRRYCSKYKTGIFKIEGTMTLENSILDKNRKLSEEKNELEKDREFLLLTFNADTEVIQKYKKEGKTNATRYKDCVESAKKTKESIEMISREINAITNKMPSSYRLAGAEEKTALEEYDNNKKKIQECLDTIEQINKNKNSFSEKEIKDDTTDITKTMDLSIKINESTIEKLNKRNIEIVSAIYSDELYDGLLSEDKATLDELIEMKKIDENSIKNYDEKLKEPNLEDEYKSVLLSNKKSTQEDLDKINNEINVLQNLINESKENRDRMKKLKQEEQNNAKNKH